MKTRPIITHLRRGASMGAFTLIELLVSMAITSVIMLTLLSLMGSTSEGYTRTMKAVNSISQARAFMLFFESELSAQLPTTYLFHEKNEPFSGPQNSQRFAFTRTLTKDEQTDTDPGDLSTSIYYVEFTEDQAGAVSPKLLRANLGPEKTQEIIDLGVPATGYFPPTDKNVDEPIVNNILQFSAQPKYINPAPTPTAAEPDPEKLLDWDTSITTASPSVIELRITFLDDSTAQAFTTATQWNDFAIKAVTRQQELENGTAFSDSDSRLQNVRTFTRLLPLGK